MNQHLVTNQEWDLTRSSLSFSHTFICILVSSAQFLQLGLQCYVTGSPESSASRTGDGTVLLFPGRVLMLAWSTDNHKKRWWCAGHHVRTALTWGRARASASCSRFPESAPRGWSAASMPAGCCSSERSRPARNRTDHSLLTHKHTPQTIAMSL